MVDDTDRMPTRRLRARRRSQNNGMSTTYSISRKASEPAARPAVAVTANGKDLEIHINGESLRVSKADGRRLLAALLETFE